MLRGFPKGRRKTEIVLEINELHFSGSKAHWGMLSLMHMGFEPLYVPTGQQTLQKNTPSLVRVGMSHHGLARTPLRTTHMI